jgi:hypothetical protein
MPRKTLIVYENLEMKILEKGMVSAQCELFATQAD